MILSLDTNTDTCVILSSGWYILWICLGCPCSCQYVVPNDVVPGSIRLHTTSSDARSSPSATSPLLTYGGCGVDSITFRILAHPLLPQPVEGPLLSGGLGRPHPVGDLCSWSRDVGLPPTRAYGGGLPPLCRPQAVRCKSGRGGCERRHPTAYASNGAGTGQRGHYRRIRTERGTSQGTWYCLSVWSCVVSSNSM